MEQHGEGRFTRKSRSRNVCDRQAWNPHLIGLYQDLTAISRFTRLGQENKEWFFTEKRHVVAPLGCDTQLNWCICQSFQHVFRGETSIVRCTSCQDVDTVCFLNSLDDVGIYFHAAIFIGVC